MRAPASAGSNLKHIRGLDTLRFAAAAWVTLAHGARLPVDRIAPEGTLGKLATALNNGMFNGVAAVMVFFIVSGLVIHLPQAGGRTLDPLDHWARRLTRILVPVILMSALVSQLGPAQREGLRGILWSVWSEVAYYLAYPLLLVAFRRYGTPRVFLAATAASLVAVAWTWPASYHSQLELAPLVVIGLPSWILGCLLAEKLASRKVPTAPSTTRAIWGWRVAALVLAAAMKLPVTHGPILIGFPASHWLFAIFAFFWVQREIARYRCVTPPPAFEAMGALSYSLYLVHMPVLIAMPALTAALFPGEGAAVELARWAATILAVAAATWAFHHLVEAPAHQLARRLGGLMRQRGASPPRHAPQIGRA